MKHVLEATVKTKAIYFIVASIVINIVSLVMNTKILIWISNAISDPGNSKWLNYVIITAVVNVGIELISIFINKFGRAVTYTYMMEKVVTKVLCSDYDMFVSHSPSDIITTCNQLNNASRMVTVYVNILMSVISFVIVFINIIEIESRLFLPIIVIYTVGGSLLRFCMKKWEAMDSNIDKIVRNRAKELHEVINGFAEVRSFHGVRDKHINSIINLNNSLNREYGKRFMFDGGINALIGILTDILTVITILYSVIAIQNGTISNTAIGLSLVTYMGRLMRPFIDVINTLDVVSEYKVSAKRYSELIEYKDKVSNGGIELTSFDSEIKFNNVDFCYDNSEYILKDISFSIKKGEHIGICGTSGGGKSTLLKLLPKYYDVTGGSITIDGIDIRELSNDSIRKHIGIVHQDTHIFDDTIGNNIRYACPGREITDVELVEACKNACIYDFILSLPEGFNTNVGPLGMKLSGGQKQRIAIARLFLMNPDIIILDEATSALDTETESIIQEALNNFKDKTMIIVAHRLSTIKNSDKIIVINEHTIEEEGTHQELMNSNGKYAAMYLNEWDKTNRLLRNVS